jgi:CCR4-NOT transcription complex subunit 1
MIQSAFRAYSSRLHLYKEINLFVNISLLNDLLKKIFLPRKRLYWEIFSQNIKNYISLAANPSIDIITDTLSSNNNNNKIIYTKNNSMKRMPVSYNKKTNIKSNNMLLPQLITSFNYIGNSENVNLDSEEIIKKLKMENEDLKKNYEILKEQYEKLTNNNKNNIIKDTQESVDLKLGDGDNLALINGSNENKDLLKLSKLKYLTKNKALKIKENLHKYFLKMFYNALLSKNSDKNKTDEVEKIEDEKYKKLRNLIVKKEKDIKNIIRNKYMIYYFKGKINEMQINNNNNNDDNEKKDLINNVNNIESIENKENKQIDNENEKNENNI